MDYILIYLDSIYFRSCRLSIVGGGGVFGRDENVLRIRKLLNGFPCCGDGGALFGFLLGRR